MKNGFDPAKNRCGKPGAFFSGDFNFASRHGRGRYSSYSSDATTSVLVVALVVRPHGRYCYPSICHCTDVPVAKDATTSKILCPELALPEQHTLPLASVRVNM